jgi:hypothetical protein
MHDISIGRGTFEGLAELQSLGLDMEVLSNCGLGQTASVAVRDILKHFRTEVEEHIRDGYCRAGVCKLNIRQPVVTKRFLPDRTEGRQ